MNGVTLSLSRSQALLGAYAGARLSEFLGEDLESVMARIRLVETVEYSISRQDFMCSMMIPRDAAATRLDFTLHLVGHTPGYDGLHAYAVQFEYAQDFTIEVILGFTDRYYPYQRLSREDPCVFVRFNVLKGRKARSSDRYKEAFMKDKALGPFGFYFLGSLPIISCECPAMGFSYPTTLGKPDVWRYHHRINPDDKFIFPQENPSDPPFIGTWDDVKKLMYS